VRLAPDSSHRARFPLPRAGLVVLAGAALVLVAPVTSVTPVEGSPAPVAVRTPLPSVVKADPIAAAVTAATGAPGPAQLGIAVLDRTTGKLALGRLGAVPFLSASVVKLVTSVDILRRTEIGTGTVNPEQRGWIRQALSASDDRAMAKLWNQFGRASTVTEMAGWAHLHDIRPPVDVARWEETKLSARDVVATYTYIFTTLNPADRQFVLDSLRAATPLGADKFDQSFGMLASPRHPGVAAKQGWMKVPPAEYLHSTGLIGPGDRYVVVVLTKRPVADDWDVGRAAVTAAVARVVSALTLTPPAARPAAPPVPKPPARPAPHHVPYPVLRTTRP
jgi:hypothetical protein